MRYKFQLMLLIMTSLTLAVAACAPKVEQKVLTPPSVLLTPCPLPDRPANLMQGNMRDYALAATRYIIELEESLAVCGGKLDGIRNWCADMKKSTPGED